MENLIDSISFKGFDLDEDEKEEAAAHVQRVSLDSLFDYIKEGEMKELNLFKEIEIHSLITLNMFVKFGVTQMMLLEHCAPMILMML